LRKYGNANGKWSQFDQYQMEKYEKVEFDMNTIDSAFMKSKLFQGMEFVFQHIDTSDVTGKRICPFSSMNRCLMCTVIIRLKSKREIKGEQKLGF
jgi:hypothetical protein